MFAKNINHKHRLSELKAKHQFFERKYSRSKAAVVVSFVFG